MKSLVTPNKPSFHTTSLSDQKINDIYWNPDIHILHNIFFGNKINYFRSYLLNAPVTS